MSQNRSLLCRSLLRLAGVVNVQAYLIHRWRGPRKPPTGSLNSIYIYIYIYIYIRTHMCVLYDGMHACMCMCVYIYIYIYICIRGIVSKGGCCLSVCVSLCLPVYVHMYVCLWVYACDVG